ncbi:MAG: hypothetical protein M3O67_10050 [Bacteroidota bacterium]|nr:hypothetical protein [Bacteroidota bacterium]
MKWLSIITSSEQEVYELWHNDQKVLSLNYNPAIGAARVKYNDEKRIFLIGKEGFLKSKTVLRNEYGFKMGQLEYEKHNAAEGFIDMYGEKFFYTIQNDPSPGLIIYKSLKEETIVKCQLVPAGGNISFHFDKHDDLHHTIYPCLLMALCWYVFLPVVKEGTIAIAI